jgi:TRAP-type C4-dicarboxylate transport system substrate-binding protein
MFRKLLTACAAIVLFVGLARDAHATTTLKIATLAPSDSPWGRNYKKYAKQVEEATNGEVQVDFQFNGTAGDEVLMVQKIRAGQLDGATLTATGLAQTGVSDVLIFQLPGLFSNWGKLDAARNAVKDDLNKEFEAKGFTVLGWGDVGACKTMTVGFEIKKPDDLRGKGVFYIAGDPVQPKFFSTLGGVTPKSLGVNEILPALTAGSINVLTVPPLAAEQMQWASRITHISSNTVAFAIGAFIMSSAKMQTLTPAQRDILYAKSRDMSDQATTMIRNLDAAAFARMKANKTVYDPDDTYRKEWADMFVKLAQQLRGTVFTPSMFDRIVQIAAPQMPL